jgi:hypothetical protein
MVGLDRLVGRGANDITADDITANDITANDVTRAHRSPSDGCEPA